MSSDILSSKNLAYNIGNISRKYPNPNRLQALTLTWTNRQDLTESSVDGKFIDAAAPIMMFF